MSKSKLDENLIKSTGKFTAKQLMSFKKVNARNLGLTKISNTPVTFSASGPGETGGMRARFQVSRPRVPLKDAASSSTISGATTAQERRWIGASDEDPVNVLM